MPKTDCATDTKALIAGGTKAKDRKRIINQAIRDITSLEAERKAITERIAEIKNVKIKGELGMKIADFSMALRLYRLEGEDRDQLFDTLKETFKALGVGAQLDWIAAVEKEEEASPSPADAPDLAAAEAEGERDGRAGTTMTMSCPFPEGSAQHARYCAGWAKGQEGLVHATVGRGKRGATTGATGHA